METSFVCSANRARDYDRNLLTASFVAWRILLFVSGSCFFIEFHFHNGGPCFTIDTKTSKQTSATRATVIALQRVLVVAELHSNDLHYCRADLFLSRYS